MMARREFKKAVKVEIVRRATKAGVVYCEECGVAARIWHIDHTIPDGLQIDKSKPLTAGDGKLLCAGTKDTCHGTKTALLDVPAIAKSRRIEAKHVGIKGKPTQLSGRDRSQIDADKATRAAARGAKTPLPPRSLFVSAGDGR